MQKLRLKYFKPIILLLFLVGLNLVVIGQAEVPQKPEEQTSVYDAAQMLSATEKNALEQKLINYADSTSTQIVVATVATVNGENIALYATKWAHDWGIGQKDEDNGMLILVAKNDRKLWITTGYGIEHLLTDNLTKRIITNIITPEFKKGNFYGGLDRGTSAIMQILNGEYQETRDFSSNGGDGIPIFLIIIFFIILIIILSNINRRGRRGRRKYRDGDAARSLLEAIILSKAGRGGFGGGGGFGGSSGGGGGFGGGFGGGGFGG
ncbi:MAG: TPM domain-containing protein, partial [Flavobacteriaceae bacterium]|nr:TPM domain-containing protein [Flavobacteriaceae bacterium]